MAAPSKPYNLSWEQQAKDLAEVNRRLTTQLANANKMLELLFTTLKDHATRIEALE